MIWIIKQFCDGKWREDKTYRRQQLEKDKAGLLKVPLGRPTASKSESLRAFVTM